ncbi:MAG: histidine kinase N-terminal domain-containing protein [Candidatus Korobacteraceae bacterium]|jgi:hypothetical protein
MLGIKFARLIEYNSELLGKGLVQMLRVSGRTDAYRLIPEHELMHEVQVLYRNLSEWLVARTELDVQQYYTRIGQRRAEQGVPIGQFVWALILGKEHLWSFMQREAVGEGALELVNELEFLLALEQFFDRALYHAVNGYAQQQKKMAA